MTSGPIGGIGARLVAPQLVGNVVQVVQAFHQLRPVPPLGCAVIEFMKNEVGRFVLAGTGFWYGVEFEPKLDRFEGTKELEKMLAPVVLHFASPVQATKFPQFITDAVVRPVASLPAAPLSRKIEL